MSCQLPVVSCQLLTAVCCFLPTDNWILTTGCWPGGSEWGNEPIPLAANRLDILRRGCIVSQRQPNLTQADPQGGLGHIDAGPDMLQEFAAGDDLPWVFEQIAQHRQRLSA